MRIVIALVFALAGATASVAAEAAAPASEPYRVNLAGVTLDSVVLYVSDFTNKPVNLPPGFPGEQPVNIVSAEGAGVPREKLMELLGRALRTAGYAMIESADSIDIVPQGQVDGVPIATGAAGGSAGEQALETRVISLKNADVSKLSGVISALCSKAGKVQTYPESNQLIITEYISQMNILQTLITELDRQSVDTESELYPLATASVESLRPTVTSYLGNIKASADPNRKKRLEAFAIHTHEPTNSFLFFGHRDDITQIKEFVALLDVKGGDKSRTVHTYHVLNRDAAELVTILGGIFDAMKGSGAPGAETAPSVFADPPNNAIIIVAPPDRFAEIKPVLDTLDEAKDQVLIESALVEVSLEKLADLGVEFATLDQPGSDARGFGGSTFDLSTITAAGRVPVPPPNGGLTAGIFKDSAFNIAALLRLSAKTSDISFIAAPQLTALDNTKAEVEISEKGEHAKSTITAEGFTQTSGGQYNEAAIKLTITPHINKEGTVRLSIEQITEQFLPGTELPDGTVLTNKTSRRTLNEVIVPTGRTAVIAGLTRTVESKIVRKVPIVGDIPLLGFFFRRTETTHQQANLCVFITPHVFEGHLDLAAETALQKEDLMERYSEKLPLEKETFEMVTGGRPHGPGTGEPVEKP